MDKQTLHTPLPEVGLELEPAQTRKRWIVNICFRVWALLWGKGPKGLYPVSVSETGRVNVSNAWAGLALWLGDWFQLTDLMQIWQTVGNANICITQIENDGPDLAYWQIYDGLGNLLAMMGVKSGATATIYGPYDLLQITQSALGTSAYIRVVQYAGV